MSHHPRAFWTVLFAILCIARGTVAADDMTKLKPGDKVVVDMAGRETTGEFVEYTPAGLLKIRVAGPGGREQTRMFPARRVHLPGDTAAGNSRTTTPRNPARRKPKMESRDGASQPTTQPGAAADDKALLLGSWKIVADEGKAATDKLVFEKERYTLGRLDGPYRIDSTQNPKQLDFGLIDDIKVPFKAIYELNGDKLRICMTTTAGQPRPTVFPAERTASADLIVCERIKAAPASSTPAQMDPALKISIQEMLTLLEAGHVEQFLKRAIPPEELAKRNEQGGLAGSVEHVTPIKGQFTATLRALLQVTPQMNADQNEALFDLTNVHVENGLPAPRMIFVKRADRWYISEKK
jgi:uncharacterized protein (TIGR03067 family)